MGSRPSEEMNGSSFKHLAQPGGAGPVLGPSLERHPDTLTLLNVTVPNKLEVNGPGAWAG